MRLKKLQIYLFSFQLIIAETGLFILAMPTREKKNTELKSTVFYFKSL